MFIRRVTLSDFVDAPHSYMYTMYLRYIFPGLLESDIEIGKIVSTL